MIFIFVLYWGNTTMYLPKFVIFTFNFPSLSTAVFASSFVSKYKVNDRVSKVTNIFELLSETDFLPYLKLIVLI